MKSKVTIGIDSMVLEEAKLYRINISKSAEEALKSYLNVVKGDVNAADEALIKRRLEKYEKKMSSLQGEISALRQSLVKIEEIKNIKEDERLQHEKEKIESAKTCHNCGRIIPEEMKIHNIGDKLICNICFRNASGDQYKEWVGK